MLRRKLRGVLKERKVEVGRNSNLFGVKFLDPTIYLSFSQEDVLLWPLAYNSALKYIHRTAWCLKLCQSIFVLAVGSLSLTVHAVGSCKYVSWFLCPYVYVVSSDDGGDTFPFSP